MHPDTGAWLTPTMPLSPPWRNRNRAAPRRIRGEGHDEAAAVAEVALVIQYRPTPDGQRLALSRGAREFTGADGSSAS
jgi:hypothetical protein